MQKQSLTVVRILIGITRMVLLHRAALGENRRTRGCTVEKLPDSIRAKDIHRTAADVEFCAGVEVTVNLHPAVVLHSCKLVVIPVAVPSGKTAEILNDHLFRENLFEFRYHIIAPRRIILKRNNCIDFIPKLPRNHSGRITESAFCEKTRLVQIRFPALRRIHVLMHVRRHPDINRIVEPDNSGERFSLVLFADGTEVFESEFNAQSEFFR